MPESDIDKELRNLGLQPQDRSVLFFIPMAMVAWADGKVDAKELNTIAESQAKPTGNNQLAKIRLTASGREFLNKKIIYGKPSDKLLNLLIDLLVIHLDSLQGHNEAAALRERIARMCVEAAKSSGGFMGLVDSISKKEREGIAKLMKKLKLRETDGGRKVFREIGL